MAPASGPNWPRTEKAPSSPGSQTAPKPICSSLTRVSVMTRWASTSSVMPRSSRSITASTASTSRGICSGVGVPDPPCWCAASWVSSIAGTGARPSGPPSS